MNEMNWMEEQLKSWAPRRPSAKIEGRLFAGRRRPAELTRVIAWLAPATACMVLALAAARPQGGSTGANRPESMFAMITSNRAFASLLTDSGAQAENCVVRANFQWTNRGVSGSSIRFIPITNSSY
jgi:hypothetical protein